MPSTVLTPPAASPPDPGTLVRAAALLDELDSRTPEGSEHVERGRRDARRSHREQTELLVTGEIGGGRRAIFTRNLSAGGLGFVLEGHLSNGSCVQVTLSRRDGGFDRVRGIIVYSRAIAPFWTCCGMRFEAAIDPSAYLG